MGAPAGLPDLGGKVALLTTDRRGWTRRLAAALAGAGADVALAGSYAPEVEASARAVEAAGRRAFALDADVTRPDEVDAMVDRVVTEMGRIDVLVNGAHVELGKPFDAVTEAEWHAVMDVNVKSVFLCCRAVGGLMLRQGGGRIVNISSGLSARGLSNSAVYAASQGAVKQLTASLALEWARDGIRVNAVGAGWLTTDAGDPDDRLARFIPSRRLGSPDDVAGLVVYLASDASDFVTGQTIYVDGGATAHA